MPLFWLRVAVVLYGIGLVYALLILVRRSDLLGRIALHAAGLAMVFHFVSLTEAFAAERMNRGIRQALEGRNVNEI